MKGSNQFTIKGKLGSDPKQHSTADNQAMAFFSVAVSNDFIDRETHQWVEKDPTWLEVTAFSHVADKAIKLKKGDTVRVFGSLTQRKQSIDTVNGSKDYGFIGLRANAIEELR